MARGREPKTYGYKNDNYYLNINRRGGVDDKIPQVNLGTPLSNIRPLSLARIAFWEEKVAKIPWSANALKAFSKKG